MSSHSGNKAPAQGATFWKSLRPATDLLPGLALTAVVAWAGIWLADFIGKVVLGFPKSPISGISVSILLGLALGNLVRLPKLFQPGIKFGLKKVLRIGIILLGIRLSIGDVLTLGALGIPIVVVCIAAGLLFTQWLGRRLNLSRQLATLIAVGTSICGASAIVATGPAINAKEEEVTYAVTNIALFGVVAMFVYPYLAHVLFGANPTHAGLFLGTAIHDTSQVAGSGLIYKQLYDAPGALDAATVVKLVRNVFMILVIPFMSYTCRRQVAAEGGECKPTTNLLSLFPMFILGFLALAIVRTVGDATLKSGLAYGLLDAGGWKWLTSSLELVATDFLAVAMASVGLGTSFKQLKKLGLQPLYAGLGAAVAVGVVSFLAITVLGLLGM
jgi:uncharacterized integral membrane protein (TIGR00698 family)